MKIKEEGFNEFKDSNKGLEVQKEKELDYYTDMYEAGQTKQKYKIGREVEGDVSGKVASGFMGWITTAGDITVSGIGFTPKLIKTSAIYNNGASSALSIGTYSNNLNKCVVSYEDATAYSAFTYCFRLSSTTVGKVTSVNSDGFVLNVTNPGNIEYAVMYECYG